MEKHEYLTELKAVWSATKSMVLAVQKGHVAHQCVIELRKIARAAIAYMNVKEAELKAQKTSLAELSAEKEKLVELVCVAEVEKQKAPTEKKDRYLRELAKIEKKKNAEIKELQKKMEDAEDRGFKEGEETYIQQCEAAKDIFSKCGWKAAIEKLGQAHDSKVFLNPLPYFIPSHMTEYTDAVQQKFFQGEEEEIPDPADASPANMDIGCQTSLPARVELHSPTEPSLTGGVEITNLTQEGEARVNLLSREVQGDLDVELDDLFA
ncbi:hypothetical protein CsSME_00042432 [Camellia sinensis var. sinensis]